jgi:hypothetical protein
LERAQNSGWYKQDLLNPLPVFGPERISEVIRLAIEAELRGASDGRWECGPEMCPGFFFRYPDTDPTGEDWMEFERQLPVFSHLAPPSEPQL